MNYPECETGRAIEVYVHIEGAEDPQLMKVDAHGRIVDLLGAGGSATVEEAIWVDSHDGPLNPDSSLSDVGVTDRCHVYRGRCPEVKVLVRYNGKPLEGLFGPASRIRHVLDWATGPRGFKLPVEQIPKHALLVPGSDHFLGPEVHVGSLVNGGRCAVSLDLLPKERFAG